MRPSLWLVIPAHRRYEVTRVSFPQLAWACAQLRERHGIDANAVVIADDNNIDIAHEHGFHTITQANRPLGRKWNDGYQYACNLGADYVCPCGTDDWLDPDYLAQLPGDRQVRASRASSTVSEDGTRLAYLHIDYAGGDGIRIIPRKMLEPSRFRPADDRKERAIDTSVWLTMNRTAPGYEFEYARDPLSIVQFQSHAPQLNTYQALVDRFGQGEPQEPWSVLRTRYPSRFVEAAKAMYAERAAG